MAGESVQNVAFVGEDKILYSGLVVRSNYLTVVLSVLRHQLLTCFAVWWFFPPLQMNLAGVGHFLAVFVWGTLLIPFALSGNQMKLLI